MLLIPVERNEFLNAYFIANTIWPYVYIKAIYASRLKK